MFNKLLSYFLNRKDSEIFSKVEKIVDKINNLENIFSKLSDRELKENTFKYSGLVLSNKETLDNILPEAYANVREASKRIFGMRHFDVQLLGGIFLNYKYVSEMKTGEGKTLTSTLPVYLNALLKKGVHVVTINDYLAKRDSEYNSDLFNFLGMTVGLNISGMTFEQKKKSYLSDITYGTNNEFVFDYLRDNMVFSIKKRVQRNLYYALLDEVDSILIDEARTPLIISEDSYYSTDLYIKINNIISCLNEENKNFKLKNKKYGDFIVDRKIKHIYLTENGIKKVEDLLLKNKIVDKVEYLYNSINLKIMHYVISALKAHYLYFINVDYIVKNNKILIVDELSGRIMFDRRWSDGLHQAIEAKENVKINKEVSVLASVTFQNYFLLYKKISGMTGTALTEASEFNIIYNLKTVSIPTNKLMIRKDLPDLIYLTEDEKINAVIEDIKYRNKIKQPVLVGTISIEKSELISSILRRIGIKHNVLNAKFHSLEAEIISNAGKLGSVTIASNMAGRGTDIVLGGNYINDISSIKDKNIKVNYIKNNWLLEHNLVVKKGGLHVIGLERHESRRIDNQLIGRSGRQGDPGSSRFYISLDDSLIKIFMSTKIVNLMRSMGMSYGEYIEHPWINNLIERAQKKIENRNFDIRKQLLDYDNIINEQRKIVYLQRNKILFSRKLNLYIKKLILEIINYLIKFKYNINYLNYIDIYNYIYNTFGVKVFLNKNINLSHKKYIKFIFYRMISFYKKKKYILGKKIFNFLEKNIMLSTLDYVWREYLFNIDNLKEGISLRSYAQKDPIQEYKIESYKMFCKMLLNFKFKFLKNLYNIPNNVKKLYSVVIFDGKNFFNDKIYNFNFLKFTDEVKYDFINKFFKFNENELCLCNSGKIYKNCHNKKFF